MSADSMDDLAYVTWLQEQRDDAETVGPDSVIGLERQLALSYYLRRPMGDERPGRSQVISGDVYKVVEGITTSIADIFTSTADAITFSPRSEDDEEKAKQRTETVMYTFWTTCKGYLPMQEAIKSGVQLKTGYLHWYWRPEKRLTRERYRGLDQAALAQLGNDPEKEVRDIRVTGKSQGVDEAGQPVELVDVEIDVIKTGGGICVEAVAPEHVHVSAHAKSSDVSKAESVFVDAWLSEGACRKAGYTDEQIEGMDFSGSRWDSSGVVRDSDNMLSRNGQAMVTTAYVEVDRDGSGVVALRQSVFSGSVLIYDDVVDEICLSAWTPNIQPHEYYGRCPADDAIQVQKLNSTLWRQGLDSLYHSTNPMWRVDKNAQRVNIDDFTNPQIGQPVRADSGSAEPIVLPYVGQHVFPMLEYSQADSENLTGWTRYNQGTDADSLNKTLGGLKMITNMTQQRVRMMARNFGEMCFAPCLRGIAKLLSQHGEKPLSMRISGRYTQVDPREWTQEFDMTVNVGLGTVDADQQLQRLMVVKQAQQEVIAGGGMGKLVTPKNIFNVNQKLALLSGIKDPTFAWTDPDTVPPPPPGPPPIPPEVQKHQMTLQADAQKFQAQAQMDQQKQGVEMQNKQAEAQQKAQLEMALAQIREEAATDRALRSKEMELVAQNMMQGNQHDMTRMGEEQVSTSAQVAELIPAMAQAMQMMAQSMQLMQAAVSTLAAPKTGHMVRNKDGSFSVQTQPMIQ